ncbi:hypothetical protein JXA84_09805 [candidate division WOR-3 bacterium]|nr:hypothetical protein [candidate division WOR-3 bacterium]
MKALKEKLFLCGSFLFFITLSLFLPKSLFSQDINLPEMHATLSIQYNSYFGEDDTVLGYLVPDDNFEMRYAAVEFEDELNDYVEYNFGIGAASCQGSGSQISLMEAGIFFKPFDFVKFGFSKGHIMRGFEAYEGCPEVLTAEKPRFINTFSVSCHPMGAVILLDYNWTDLTGLSVQLSYLNGSQRNTAEKEHDINAGMVFRTPIQGLSLAGFYNDLKLDFEYDNTLDKASRSGFGFDYEDFNINLRGEYYTGKGFFSSYPEVKSEDLQMSAYYIEGGYKIKINSEIFPFIQPYMMYQSWDKANNTDGEHVWTYLTAGMTFGLGSENTKLRLDFETSLNFPEDTPREASRVLVRLQTHF